MIAVVEEMYIESEVRSPASDESFFRITRSIPHCEHTSDLHRCKGGRMSFETLSHHDLSFETHLQSRHHALYTSLLDGVNIGCMAGALKRILCRPS